jgi:cyclase
MPRLHHAMVSALCLLLAPVAALAHSGAPPDQEKPAPTFTLQKLTDRAYCLFGQGGNVGFLVTDAGVLVVDDQFENVAQGIIDQIKTVTDKPIRYLVNTHYHSDHTGGNPVFIKFAEIIAHDTVRPRLLEYPEEVRRTFPAKQQAMEAEIATIQDPNDLYRVALEKDVGLIKFLLDSLQNFKVETAAPPGLTYEGHVRVWLGGQQIEVFHIAPGHTDGDSMVYFKDENVIHMGDLLFNGMYPFIDAEGGGSEAGCIENLDYAIAHVPPDIKVIPGHGPVTDMAGLRRMRDFLRDLRVKVDKAVKAGMSRADTVRAIKMDEYPDIKPLFRSLGNVITVAYDELKAKR